MTKNRQIFVLILLFLILGILLCGFKIGSNFQSYTAKSISKNVNYCNTSANFSKNSAENIEIVPIDPSDEIEPNIIPYQKNNSTQKKVGVDSRSAKSNLTSSEIVIEQSSKRVLYGKNENVQLYPASTTKVLTALCVLNSLPLEKVVSVPKEAVGVEGSSLYLKKGQKITVEDLLYGLMLRSGNDAAVTLAIETSGSVENFAKLMNDTAKKCGAINSSFVNPHGLHDENHYTTAHDLALIAAKAYENPDFVRIVSSKTRKINVDDVELVIANKNKMLKLYEGANGVKTGFTKSSGRCLVSGARRGDMQLISVVLNCGDMWNESVRLLNFGFDNFEMVPFDNALLTDGEEEIFAEFTAPVDENWREIKFPLRKDGSESLRFD